MMGDARFMRADSQQRERIRKLLAVCLVSGVVVQCCGCTSVSPPIISPGRKFEARIIEINGGATEPFRSVVEIRRKWSFARQTVFSGEFGSKELDISWIDDSHLKIRFPEENFPWTRFADCIPSWKEVSVSCEVVYPLANSRKPS